jgi:competence protein ComEC
MLQTGTLVLLAGILILQTQAVLPSVWWLGLLPIAVAGIFVCRRHALKLVCCLLAGFLWAQFQAAGLLQQRLPLALNNKNLQVRGFIASLPERVGDRTRFEFDISEINSPQLTHYPHRVRLSWYSDSPVALQPGDKWQLSLRLRTPHNFMTPGAFDYTAWLLEKGIVATGYVDNHGDNRMLARSGWRYPIQSLRFHCRSQLQTALAGMPSAGLIIALVIGDRSGISQSDWTALQQTGTVHLMAISGLHIGLIAGFMFFIVLRLWRRFPRACLWLPAPKAAAISAWLAALLYAALAGFAIPTQRALIMLAVILLSVYLQRTYKPSQVIAMALLLVLCWDPFAVLSASFWLSFCAVALIYYVLQILPRRSAPLLNWWRMQLAISLGLLPLVVLFFQQAPILSPFTNLIAIPWVSLLVLPLALISTLVSLISHALGSWGLQLAAWLMHLLQDALAWAASLKWSLVYLPSPTPVSLVLAMVGIAVFLLPRAFHVRYLGVCLCLPAFLPAMKAPVPGDVRLSLLDVGQGLATVIQTRHHTLVFDTGPHFSQRLDAGEAVILPFLRQQHVQVIDTLLISHSDMDHIGGAKSLLAALPVSHIISSVPRILRDARDTSCVAGDQWRWDGVEFEILYPSRFDLADTSTDNNRSCVLQITTAEQRLLLTGDVEAPAEARLVARYGEKLRSGILVIPHHGSKTSSTPAFLDAVQPNLVLIPAGWHNRFHLPAPQVLARLQARQFRVLNTATVGTVQIDVGQQLQVRRYRDAHRRYWQVW